MRLLAEWRVTVFGLLSWALPFIAAILFFGSSGQPVVPQPLFKSLMVVIGALVVVVLLALLFRRVRPTFAAGLAIGLYWMVLSLVLDVVILVPMWGESLTDYYSDIGVRYLVLPVIAAGMGFVGQRSA